MIQHCAGKTLPLAHAHDCGHCHQRLVDRHAVAALGGRGTAIAALTWLPYRASDGAYLATAARASPWVHVWDNRALHAPVTSLWATAPDAQSRSSIAVNATGQVVLPGRVSEGGKRRARRQHLAVPA